MRYPSLLLVLLAFTLAAPQTILAHGVPPAGRSLFVVNQGDAPDDRWVYVTNFGVITPEFSDRYVCEEAFFGGDRFLLAPLGLRDWAFFTPRQAGYTEDGCVFEETLALPTLPTDMAIDPETRHLAFTVESPDGSEIWRSLNFGRSFEKLSVELGPIRPTALGYLDTDTLLLLGYSNQEDSWGKARMITIDLETLELQEIPLEEGLRFPALLDARAGHLLWHARRDNQTEIYWGPPDEPTRGAYFTPRWPLSGALSLDGQTAYLGGVDENSRGIFTAGYEDPSSWEELLPGHRTLCLTATVDGLYACGHRESDGHDLLFIDLNLQLLELLDFRDLQGPRDDCPETSTTAQICPVVWPETAAMLSLDFDSPESSPTPDEEPDEDPEPADDQEEPAEEQASGCSTTSGPSSPLFLLLFLALLAGLPRRNKMAA